MSFVEGHPIVELALLEMIASGVHVIVPEGFEHLLSRLPSGRLTTVSEFSSGRSLDYAPKKLDVISKYFPHAVASNLAYKGVI